MISKNQHIKRLAQFSVASLLFFCSCSAQDYEFERDVHTKALDSLAKLDVDMVKVQAEMVAWFEEQDMINGNDPKWLQNLINKIAKHEVAFQEEPILEGNINYYEQYQRIIIHYINESRAGPDSLKAANSHLTQTFTAVADTLYKAGDINPDSMMLHYLRIANEASFKEDFYQTFLTGSVLWSSDASTGFEVKLPPVDTIPPKDVHVNQRFVLKILVTSTDELLIEGVPQEMEVLKQMVNDHIVKYEDKAIVSLQNARGTSYQKYLDVYNEITAAYNDVRDNYAYAKFGKKYGELSHEEAKVVKQKYPKKLLEAEPY